MVGKTLHKINRQEIVYSRSSSQREDLPYPRYKLLANLAGWVLVLSRIPPFGRILLSTFASGLHYRSGLTLLRVQSQEGAQARLTNKINLLIKIGL